MNPIEWIRRQGHAAAVVVLHGLLLIHTAPCSALEAPNPVEARYAVETIPVNGQVEDALDFDLDRHERVHLAAIETLAEEAGSRQRSLVYHRFDGVVWRSLQLSGLGVTTEAAEQGGHLAVALSERSAPMPAFNTLYFDAAGAGAADDAIRLARVQFVGTTPTISIEFVMAGTPAPGMQLEAAPDGILHAIWKDAATPRILHAIRTQAGAWQTQEIMPAAQSPGPPAAAMNASGRLLLGFVVNGQVQLREWLGNNWQVIAAPVFAGVQDIIAIHFRGSDGIGVAAVNVDGDQLHYVRGDANAFPPTGVAWLFGSQGAFQLRHRRALSNQENGALDAWLAFDNAGESQLTALPASGFSAALETQQQIGGKVQGVLLRDTRRYLLSLDLDGHRDPMLHVQGAHWTLQQLAIGLGGPVLSRVNDADGSPVLLLRGPSALQVATWSEPDNGFVATDVPTNLLPPTNEASLAYLPGSSNVPATLIIAFFHTGARRLQTLERIGAGNWQAVYVDPTVAAGSGREPQVAVDDAGQRYIVHANLDEADQLFLTRYGPNPGGIDVIDAQSADLSQARARLAVVPASGDVYVSHFAAGISALRLRHIRPDGSAVASTLSLPDIVTGERHALTTDLNGLPVLVYSVRSGNETGLRYRFQRDQQVVDEVLRSVAPQVSYPALDISLKNENPELARVAFVINGGTVPTTNLYFAQRRIGFSPSVLPWRTQQFSGYQSPTAGAAVSVDAAAGDRVFVLQGGVSPGLNMARRRSEADDQGQEVYLPLPPVQRFGSNFACQCPGQEGAGQTPLDECRIVPARNAETTTLSGSAEDLFPALRTRFDTTEAGRYYLALWAEHGDEIIWLTLKDPRELAQRIRTLADFRQGLAAFAAGQGSQVRMTPEMLVQARRVFEGWRDRGSPGLRAVAQAELTRLQNLTVFNDLTFDQWFAALTVGTSGATVFRDGFE